MCFKVPMGISLLCSLAALNLFPLTHVPLRDPRSLNIKNKNLTKDYGPRIYNRRIKDCCLSLKLYKYTKKGERMNPSPPCEIFRTKLCPYSMIIKIHGLYGCVITKKNMLELVVFQKVNFLPFY